MTRCVEIRSAGVLSEIERHKPAAVHGVGGLERDARRAALDEAQHRAARLAGADQEAVSACRRGRTASGRSGAARPLATACFDGLQRVVTMWRASAARERPGASPVMDPGQHRMRLGVVAQARPPRWRQARSARRPGRARLLQHQRQLGEAETKPIRGFRHQHRRASRARRPRAGAAARSSSRRRESLRATLGQAVLTNFEALSRSRTCSRCEIGSSIYDGRLSTRRASTLRWISDEPP